MKHWIQERRWFRAKAKALASIDVDETFALELGSKPIHLVVLRCEYEDATSDRYVLVNDGSWGFFVPYSSRPPVDALEDPAVLAGLLEQFKGAEYASDKGSTLRFRAYPGFTFSAQTPRVIGAEQTNTSVVYGDAFILKLVRKLDEGTSAELEMGEFLTRHGYAGAPPVLGTIELEHAGSVSTVGVLHRLVPNRGDAWSVALNDMGAALGHAALLGRRVGEMHVVLAAGSEPAFVPERIGVAARQKLAEHVESEARAVDKHLRPGDLARIARRLAAFRTQSEDPIAMRIHGDLHLGQILATESDFVIIDFEGEPSRTLAERKSKRSPLADVAGMLRSFDYAAATAFRDAPAEARAWYEKAAAAFVAAYRDATRRSALLTMTDDAWTRNLDFYLFEKAIYEVAYEANNRPDWIAIPQGGIAALLDA